MPEDNCFGRCDFLTHTPPNFINIKNRYFRESLLLSEFKLTTYPSDSRYCLLEKTDGRFMYLVVKEISDVINSLLDDKNYVKKKERERHYLATDSRHHQSLQIAMKVDKVCSFQPALRPSSAEEEDG